MSTNLHVLTSYKADGRPGNFTVNVPNPVKLETGPETVWQIAMMRATYKNTIRNIRAAFSNNVFQYSPDAGVTTKVITIRDGYYQLKELNSYIQAHIKSNGDNLPGDLPPISIQANFATVRVVITCAPGYQVIWTGPTDQLAALLGFDATINIDGGVAGIAFEGDLPPDINRGADQILILCDLASASYRNGHQLPVIYTCTLSGKPGSVIDEKPSEHAYIDMDRSGNQAISRINVQFTDLQGRELDFNGFDTTVTIHLRAVDLGSAQG